MARNKNKPKKGGAVVSPAESPAGKTEVIVGASAAVTAAGTAVAATTTKKPRAKKATSAPKVTKKGK